jgi:hypothetical protein
MLFRHQRKILFLAAIFNIIGGLITLISPAFFFSQFFVRQPDMYTTFPFLSMYHYLFWALILLMGIAYWMAAVDPAKNRAVIFIGAFGKLFSAAMMTMLYVQGEGKWGMIAVIAESAVLGALMLYLFFGKQPSQQ